MKFTETVFRNATSNIKIHTLQNTALARAMAELSFECPPRTKKTRRSAPFPKTISELSSSKKIYTLTDGGLLFCKFCDHSVDLVKSTDRRAHGR